MYPIPLAPRPAPPALPDDLHPELGDEGELFVADVKRSLFPMPASRPIRELRVFQVLPKSETHIANQPRLGYANAEPARMLLGTVPVAADGSACFRAPARRPLYFQAVDAEGKAVQGMRSAAYLQPGERRGCVGCHEPPGTSPSGPPPLALRGPPSRIQPGPDGSRPWSFPRLVQPVLNSRCVRCHGGEGAEGSLPPDLRGEPTERFSVAYESLKPHVRWYEWGGSSIGGAVTRPGRMPADESPLTRIIDDASHAGEAGLTADERRRLYLWLDGNAAFYGAYSQAEQAAQRRGEAVRAPELQ
jgi:mono/diheme cytochrome c family protein